ncbi:hypothetical protein GALMADRAFT_1118845 [Galerina marginata CBS 339.88]|uniref:Uncharacterized protein n=1 Tax=Galerina marginata (strain CBS 339.88) TaxID=685588 RepID=A0A067TF92_GALM3|nr:hypothetical protein GALMADRAFT_1118845 [Galerina marginata CBS 339.88]
MDGNPILLLCNLQIDFSRLKLPGVSPWLQSAFNPITTKTRSLILLERLDYVLSNRKSTLDGCQQKSQTIPGRFGASLVLLLLSASLSWNLIIGLLKLGLTAMWFWFCRLRTECTHFVGQAHFQNRYTNYLTILISISVSHNFMLNGAGQVRLRKSLPFRYGFSWITETVPRLFFFWTGNRPLDGFRYSVGNGGKFISVV